MADSCSDDSNTVIVEIDNNANIQIQQKNNSVDDPLSVINKSFEISKANQILRLLKDQEELNKIFVDCDNNSKEQCPENNSKDNSDSDSVQNMERRLNRRLSVYRQRDHRSKTSMGFNKDTEPVISSDEDDTEMTQAPVPVPVPVTRMNRPKSSYIRRTSAVAANRQQCEPQKETDDSESQNQRRPAVRPKSRLGRRPSAAGRREVLKETTNTPNTPFMLDEDDGAECVDDLIEVKDYDNCVPAKAGLKRQRSNLKLRRYGDKGASETSASGEYTHNPVVGNYNEQENIEELNDSPIMRHRRQQMRSAHGSRPTSESVYLVRQKTENGFVRTPSNMSTASLRPKSEKLSINGPIGNRNILSIDANPNQGNKLSNVYSVSHQEGGAINTTQGQGRLNYGAAIQQRPVSRRGSMRAEMGGPVRSQTKNTSVYGARPQPISFMKLPPLDPAVSQRAERSLVIPATHETCA